ncbi:MAG: alpha/beta fold hydrolase [Chloroflexi bacterium]|nr:alpha/beta fold hydrolase [Chloroflexota bacterium]
MTQYRDRTTDPATEAVDVAGGADAALGINPLAGISNADMLAAFQQVATQTIRQPLRALNETASFFQEVTRALTGQSDLAPGPKDKRFTDPAWKENPLYRAWLQTYLAWGKSLQQFVAGLDLPEKDEQRAEFVASLITDAAAPTNSWLGNPAAIKTFLDTGGTSAARGLMHLVRDLAEGGGTPAQVDKSAFKVGENLAVSPGAVVFKNEVLELIQYTPATERVYRRPVLVMPPQINKFYIIDLAPGRSFTEFAVKNGFQVFTISWRNPTPAQRDWGLDTYVQAALEAMDAVRAITRSENVNLLGACSGGITMAVMLGHLAATEDRRAHTATLMVAVLDTEAESQLGMFATPETIAAAKAASRARGVLEGQELARVFAWLRPNDLVWNYWVNNYLLGNDPPAFDILYWNNDTTNLPARLHAEYLDMVLNNPFHGGKPLTLLGTPIDPSKVELDTFMLAGLTDHITPWKACFASTQILGGHKEFVLSSSGHVQSIVNPPGNPKARYFLNPDLPADPDAWLGAAQERPGSWWEHWRDWLAERSGGQKNAPTALGNKQHPPGAKAPGRYVLE